MRTARIDAALWGADMRGLAVTAVMTLLTSACTTTMNYTPPVQAGVVNSAKIERSFETVWDQLVRELSSDFFVINNIDKNSRLINISFSSDRPSDFIDCGDTARSSDSFFSNGTTRYKTADSTSFRTTNKIGQPFDVVRTTKLNGRANIYVAPEGPATSVIVNTKYILNIRTSATALNGRPAGQVDNSIDFSTKSPSSGSATAPACATKGVIETKILSMASPRK